MLKEHQFNRICEEYSDDIFRYSLAMLRDRTETEDATQEVLLKIWKKLPLFQLKSQKAWILRITRNHCLDRLRQRKAEARKVGDGETALSNEPDHSIPPPGEKHDQTAVSDFLQQALEELSEIHRSVFVLFEINGLRHREIAQTLNIPASNSKVYLLRARRELKSILQQEATWIQNYIN